MNISLPSSETFTLYCLQNNQECEKTIQLLKNFSPPIQIIYVDSYKNQNFEEFSNFINTITKNRFSNYYPIIFFKSTFVANYKKCIGILN